MAKIKLDIPKGNCKNGTLILVRPKEVFKTATGIVVNQDISAAQDEKDMFDAQLKEPKRLLVLKGDGDLPYKTGDSIILAPGAQGIRKKMGNVYVMLCNGHQVMYHESGDYTEGDFEIEDDQMYNPEDQKEFSNIKKLEGKQNG